MDHQRTCSPSRHGDDETYLKIFVIDGGKQPVLHVVYLWVHLKIESSQPRLSTVGANYRLAEVGGPWSVSRLSLIHI